MADDLRDAGGCISYCTGDLVRDLIAAVDSGMEYPVAPEYAEAIGRIEAAQENDVVERALSAARDRLAMDASYVTTIDPTEQTIHAIVGQPEIVNTYTGVVMPVDQTFCQRMLNGEIPNVVPDTRAEPAMRDLDATREFGAYIGVPVRLSDGRVHGTLCCVSREAKFDIGPEDLRFMQVLAGIIAARVDQAQGDMARLTARFRAG
jgi:GAF domain-containing protein